jgi:hypothetical protein
MKHSLLRGRDLHAPTNEIVVNATGDILPVGKVVRLNGVNIFPEVLVADPLVYNNFGIVAEEIKPGKTGLVTTLGFLFEIDTSDFEVDDVLYSDSLGNLTSLVNGSPVALVVKKDPMYGIIRVDTVGNLTNTAPAWDLDGNGGINPSINFLGTTDSNPLNIRTNNEFRATIDENGRLGLGLDDPQRHFHIKSHAGYDGSGLQIETFALQSLDDHFVLAYEIVIDNPSVVRVEVVLTARQANGFNRAMFKRTGLFYREGGNVQIQGVTWISDQTEKSHKGYDIGYVMGISTLSIMVKNANTNLTNWTGHIKIEEIT